MGLVLVEPAYASYTAALADPRSGVSGRALAESRAGLDVARAARAKIQPSAEPPLAAWIADASAYMDLLLGDLTALEARVAAAVADPSQASARDALLASSLARASQAQAASLQAWLTVGPKLGL